MNRAQPKQAQRSTSAFGLHPPRRFSVIPLPLRVPPLQQRAEERLPRCRGRNLLFGREISLPLSFNCKRPPPPLCNLVGSKRGKLRVISSFRSSTFFLSSPTSLRVQTIPIRCRFDRFIFDRFHLLD